MPNIELSLDTAEEIDTAAIDLENAINKAYELDVLKNVRPSTGMCSGGTKS